MPSSKFFSWAQYLFVGGLVLMLVVFVPATWFPLQLGKIILFSALFLLAGTCFILGRGMSALQGRNTYPALLVAALPLTYLTSWYFGVDKSLGIVGSAVETDTLVFTVLLFLAFMGSFLFSRNPWFVRLLLIGIISAACIAALFQSLVLFGGGLLPISIFTDRSVNVVGKWNDLGLLAGLGVILLLVWVEYASPKRAILALSLFAILALGGLIALIQFPFIWALLFGGCVLVAVWSFVTKRTVPWMPLAGAVVSVGFLLWGSMINAGLTRFVPVSSLEVRPSFTSTLDIVRAAHGDSLQQFLIGSGPQTFGENWLLHKPNIVNQSQFWSVDFVAGFSTCMTALGTVGVVGALMWFVPLVLALLGFIRASLLGQFSSRERLFLLSLALSSVYLWCALMFYVPSQSLVVLGFVLCGAVFGFATKNTTTNESAPSLVRVALGATVLLAFVLLLVGSTVLAGRRLLSTIYINKAAHALTQRDIDQALVFAERAKRIETTNDALRAGIEVRSAKLERMAADIPKPTEDEKAQFLANIQEIESIGTQSITLFPKDYRTYLSLAKVYTFLATLNVKDAYESAQAGYQKAAHYNPTDPHIPLLWARLELLHNNRAGYQTQLTRALTLKPDYTDAILLVVQVYLADKDIPNAIIATQAAVKSAPGVAPLWFELGLLLYSNNNARDAIPVLEQALKLEPHYANAKYFLGLSYAAIDRMQDAVGQFEDLQKTNPNNTEVLLILSNLRAGKAPFTDAQLPITTSPQTRETAPITQ